MTTINDAFKLFGDLIERRFRRILSGEASFSNIALESEDTIRYMMFHALTYTLGVKPEFVFLEYPHPNVLGKKYPKLDTFIESHNGVPSMAFEMKFTINNEENKNGLPKTRIFGALISDLIRLHNVPNVGERFFVWIFDKEMEVYIHNKHEPWENMITGESFEFIDKDLKKLPKTALNKVRELIEENLSIRVSLIYARDINAKGRIIRMRVYSIDGIAR